MRSAVRSQGLLKDLKFYEIKANFRDISRFQNKLKLDRKQDSIDDDDNSKESVNEEEENEDEEWDKEFNIE